MNDKPKKIWQGDFGKEYTDRNALSVEELNELYFGYYGINAERLYHIYFCPYIKGSDKVLQIGCSSGSDLMVLKKLGYNDVWGLEIQKYAVALSKRRIPSAQIVHGVADDIPFKDGFFDVVFTSGLLIHIPPEKLCNVLQEMVRVSKRFIFGLECFSSEMESVHYRDNDNLMWKADYPKYMMKQDNNLNLLFKKYLSYQKNSNTDIVYMIEKESGK